MSVTAIRNTYYAVHTLRYRFVQLSSKQQIEETLKNKYIYSSNTSGLIFSQAEACLQSTLLTSVRFK